MSLDIFLSVVASIIAIFVFLTGRNSVQEIFSELLNTKRELERLQRETERLNQEIKIILREQVGEKREIEIPAIVRKDLTRAEIQGRVGCIPTNTNKRYQIEYFVTQNYYEKIRKYNKEDITDPFVIPLVEMDIKDKSGNVTGKQSEYDQFNFSGSAWRSTISSAN